MLLNIPQRRRRTISLTPLVDVVFILLVFFMLASSFTDWRHYDIGTGTGVAGSEQPVATIAINNSRQWSLDGLPVSGPEAIATALKTRLETNPELTAVLQPAGQLPLQITIDALDTVKLAGISDISLATAETNGPTR